MSDSLAITFVLPGSRRSGGTAVTIAMAHELLRRGHHVRVAYRTAPVFLPGTLRAIAGRLKRGWAATRRENGLIDYEGPHRHFTRLDDLYFQPGEIVIAVGSLTVQAVADLQAPVLKARYCHGLANLNGRSAETVWGGSMPTIAVSPTLTEPLERLNGAPVLGIVPNGIDLTHFYEEPETQRTGIGMIYGDHESKDPQTILSLLDALGRRWPDRPRLVFGSEPRPAGMQVEQYHYLPDTATIRGIYNRSLIWLVASRSEGFGLPILEAMACGAAVISTSTDGARYLIDHGRNGIMSPIGDMIAFLTAVERLLEDEPLRQKLVEGGRRTVRTFGWAAAADAMEECLERLCTEAAVA